MLNKLEQHLPVSIFSAEWFALGEGKDKQKYMSFTKSEKKVPILFLIVYSVSFLIIIALKVPIIKEAVKYYLKL